MGALVCESLISDRRPIFFLNKTTCTEVELKDFNTVDNNKKNVIDNKDGEIPIRNKNTLVNSKSNITKSNDPTVHSNI